MAFWISANVAVGHLLDLVEPPVQVVRIGGVVAVHVDHNVANAELASRKAGVSCRAWLRALQHLGAVEDEPKPRARLSLQLDLLRHALVDHAAGDYEGGVPRLYILRAEVPHLLCVPQLEREARRAALLLAVRAGRNNSR